MIEREESLPRIEKLYSPNYHRRVPIKLPISHNPTQFAHFPLAHLMLEGRLPDLGCRLPPAGREVNTSFNLGGGGVKLEN